MEGIYLLYIIPFVFIQTIYAQDTEPQIIFPYSQNPRTVLTNSNLKILCALSESLTDGAVFTWKDKAGNVISNQNSGVSPYIRTHTENGPYKGGLLLNIDNVDHDDAGKYNCSAAVADNPPYVGVFEVKVKTALKIINCDNSQFGVLGKQSRISCSATAGPVAVISSWDYGGVPLRSDDKKYKYDAEALIILNTTEADAGNYTLSAYTVEADSDAKSRKISFNVYIAPVITKPISLTTAIEGKEAVLYCSADGVPPPEIEWRKQGDTNILRTTDRIEVSTNVQGGDVQGILKFKSVSKDDEEIYSCTAKNLASDDDDDSALNKAENKLIVHTPPKIEVKDTFEGTEGMGMELVCNAHGDPAPEMTWTKVVPFKSFSNDGDISVVSETIKDVSNPGTKLTLKFKSLNHEDAGEYKCWAKNSAAETEKVVTLEVRYRPNFDAQEETSFYTWNKDSDPYIVCTVNANPDPVFQWYKGDKAISNGDSFFSVIPAVTDDTKPNVYTSKLQVTYNNANDEAVFGKYSCMATNAVGSNNITLDLEKAVVPSKPSVTIEHFDATRFYFHLVASTVKGPQVTHFKVTYKRAGSNDNFEQTVAREIRDFIDVNRRYTELKVENLNQSTAYVFTFYAINEVGQGPGEQINRQTPALSKPDIPVISTEYNSPLSTVINVHWKAPSDGGSAILEYIVKFQEVRVKNETSDPLKGYELLEKISNPTTIPSVKETSKRIERLLPGRFYEVTVFAKNGVGVSLGGTKIIRTKVAEAVEGATSEEDNGLSTGVIIGIVIGVFFLLFIIVDLTCYFKNKCGILMSIREKVGGGREEGYAVAKTEDVENLAKKDELTEEVKATEEGQLAETIDDDKKAPLLSEEQKVDTVDEGETKQDNVELEPEDKEPAKTEETKPETPKQEEAPTEPAKTETPASDEKPQE